MQIATRAALKVAGAVLAKPKRSPRLGVIKYTHQTITRSPAAREFRVSVANR